MASASYERAICLAPSTQIDIYRWGEQRYPYMFLWPTRCTTMLCMRISADMRDLTVRLQEAVRIRDRVHLETVVSDRMIWVVPSADSRRGKREWIEASCSVAWDWFDVRVLREVDLGTTRVVECWIKQQYRPSPDGTETEPPPAVASAGVVSDVWSMEGGEWRLVARHPQRAAE